MTPAQQEVVDTMHKSTDSGLFSDRIKHQKAIQDANMTPLEPIFEPEVLENILRLETELKELKGFVSHKESCNEKDKRFKNSASFWCTCGLDELLNESK